MSGPTSAPVEPLNSLAPGHPIIRVDLQTFSPQSGPQEMFFNTKADIALYGGAAGGGKTFGLLIEASRWVNVPGYGAVIFRRTHPEIRNEGGMWDESFRLYQPIPLNGQQNETRLEWSFPPHGNTITFAHMQHEHDRFKWQGAQIAFLGFDELTTFTWRQFVYMLSRNRSTSGVKPYIRATCNPDADSWVAKFIAWWIDEQTGYPIPERAGKLRWFRIQDDDNVLWADTPEALADGDFAPLSFTFIPATIYDNTALLAKDPGYLDKLRNLPLVERERLLGGNWKIRPSRGLVFNRSWFDVIESMPTDVLARVRYWDKAGTPGSDSYCVGVKMAITPDATVIVEHVIRDQWLAPERNRVMLQTARMDGPEVFVWIEQEPGSGGKESAELSVHEFLTAGFIAESERVTGEKVARAESMSGYAEKRRVKLLKGHWNEAYLDELDRFPESAHDDQADASSGAFNKLMRLWHEMQLYGFSPEAVAAEARAAPPMIEVASDNFIEAELFANPPE